VTRIRIRWNLVIHSATINRIVGEQVRAGVPAKEIAVMLRACRFEVRNYRALAEYVRDPYRAPTALDVPKIAHGMTVRRAPGARW